MAWGFNFHFATEGTMRAALLPNVKKGLPMAKVR